MPNIESKAMSQKCLVCGNPLLLETKTWKNISGALLSVFCPNCKVRGKGAADVPLAMSKFDRALTRAQYQKSRKPEKILTDIYNYLGAILDEWLRRQDEPHFIENNIGVYNHIRKEMDDLVEYAEKLGVEL